MNKSMQKRITLLALTLAFVLTISGTVSAADLSDQCSGDVQNNVVAPEPANKDVATEASQANSVKDASTNSAPETQNGDSVTTESGNSVNTQNNKADTSKHSEVSEKSSQRSETKSVDPVKEEKPVSSTSQTSGSVEEKSVDSTSQAPGSEDTSDPAPQAPTSTNNAVLNSAPTPANLDLTLGSWNIIGLDHNKPETEGPNQFLIQVHVKNIGSTTATDVMSTLSFLTPLNPYVSLAPGETSGKSLGDIAPGVTKDLFWLIQVARDSAAFGTTQDYKVEVTGLSGSTPISTTLPDQTLLIEKLVGAADQYIKSITASDTTPNIGDLFTVTVESHGAHQKAATISIPVVNYGPTIVQPVSVTTSYGSTSTPNLRIDADPLTKDFTSVWTFKAVGTGSTTLVPFIYNHESDPPTSAYHYNKDYGEDTVTIIVKEVELAVTKTANHMTPDYLTNVIFTILVENKGPDDATGVKVTDKLPVELDFVSASDGGIYDPATRIVTWDIGVLANGASKTLYLTAKVMKSNTEIPNTACAVANEAGPVCSTVTIKVPAIPPTPPTPPVPPGPPEPPMAAGEPINKPEFEFAAAGEPEFEIIEVPVFEEFAAAGAPVVQAAEEFLPAAGEPVRAEGVPMKEAGIPIGLLVLAVLMVLAGLLVSKK